MGKSVDVSLPSDTELAVTRVFEAPARLVFDFHTRPEHVRRWLLGPPGWSMPVCEIDLRIGGGYRYVWRNDADGTQFGTTGTYREIVEPTRIVHTENMEGFEGESLCTLTLLEDGAMTTLTYVFRFQSRAARDGAMSTGMTDGMGLSYDRLDEAMAEAVQ
ncbi:ATPase [Youhaiella tibetensis]|uniref:ATPase n=1 Tax=Paradevosia tibetensis TaxID=1447062 RepID=A0A5B9DS44_9HYPH|nr:SRPBCC family protein [Youhaiella tibetensis]QEE21609.1 ATPase [Youhaiella tibetensis]GGF13319.1 ATPase [Youhaiella tibetensis]